jgi:hypothetical protein
MSGGRDLYAHMLHRAETACSMCLNNRATGLFVDKITVVGKLLQMFITLLVQKYFLKS